MKGDASCHTTSEKYRAGYDAIDWSDEKNTTHRDECIGLSSGMHMICGCHMFKKSEARAETRPGA